MVTTYRFFSSNENPTGGVPGLMKYCVYPTPSSTTLPAIHVDARGFNNALWVGVKGTKNFGFVRPGGNTQHPARRQDRPDGHRDMEHPSDG